jgi:YVTN family beta-propeller protein
MNIALAPDDSRLYAANGSSANLSVIDLKTNAAAGEIALAGKPWGIAVAPR